MNNAAAPHLWVNARLYADPTAAIQATAAPQAMAVADGKIVWIGPSAAVDAAYRDWPQTDLRGAWVLPAFVDCHTHLVWAGSRFHEFEMRQQGLSYAQIAQAGGGIRSTVQATRQASEAQLFAQAKPRLQALIREGVTTVEIKSGYGLDTASELKTLRVARALGAELGVDVHTTFLGAHALPPEYDGRSDDYIRLLCEETLPAAVDENLVDAVDAFCESIAFSPAQVERLFMQARALGLPVKLHAEQLSDSGGAALAAYYQALSCDHLEWLSESGAAAMAAAGTVAVLLPGAFYFLRETRKPPVEMLRRHGVAMAVSTDLNPGSSPIASILTALHQSGVLFGLTPSEALAAVTVHAARALGCHDRGTLAAGFAANFTVWSFADPRELAYSLGLYRPLQVIHRGRPLSLDEAAPYKFN